MGRSYEEGSPIQPDGGLLSLLGDLLFAGAILVMIYPCLRKTANRLDRQFFHHLLYILEVLLAVAALCFVLMLLIAQQMRVTYCSFIRPYIGDTPEDKAYAGVLLKILVCALLVLNYFCASGLQRILSSFCHWVQHGGDHNGRFLNGRIRRPRYVSSRDTLSNNSNTNSQTPVTQTQTVTHSDILPSMSMPVLPSDSHQGALPVLLDQEQCLYRDVGTMVRFPEYQSSLCTLQLCRGATTDHSGHGPVHSPIVLNPRPCGSTSSFLPSTQGSSTGFSASFHSTCQSGVPGGTLPSTCQNGVSGVQSNPPHPVTTAQSSAHQSGSTYVHSGTQCGQGLVSGHSSYHSHQTSIQSSYHSNLASLQGSYHSHPPGTHSSRCHVGPCLVNVHGTCQNGPCLASVHSNCRNGAVRVQSVCQTVAANGQSTSGTCSAIFHLPRQRSTVQVKRRRRLPMMPKMTRSGKIYGYG